MADFRIWARVERVGTRQFFAIVSAVHDPPDASVPIVLTALAPSLAEANQQRDRLAIEAGRRVRERGDRVVDVEDS